jgi:hypothetical protein
MFLPSLETQQHVGSLLLDPLTRHVYSLKYWLSAYKTTLSHMAAFEDIFQYVLGLPARADAMGKVISEAWKCLTLATLSCHIALGAPSGFPASGNGLWYTTPATDWLEGYLPIGNGFLAGELQNLSLIDTLSFTC